MNTLANQRVAAFYPSLRWLCRSWISQREERGTGDASAVVTSVTTANGVADGYDHSIGSSKFATLFFPRFFSSLMIAFVGLANFSL